MNEWMNEWMNMLTNISVEIWTCWKNTKIAIHSRNTIQSSTEFSINKLHSYNATDDIKPAIICYCQNTNSE